MYAMENKEIFYMINHENRELDMVVNNKTESRAKKRLEDEKEKILKSKRVKVKTAFVLTTLAISFAGMIKIFFPDNNLKGILPFVFLIVFFDSVVWFCREYVKK